MRRRFLGGVHPVSYKESTRRKPIMPLEEPPKQVAIPLTMCTGGGAVPVVKPGDTVKKKRGGTSTSRTQTQQRGGEFFVTVHSILSYERQRAEARDRIRLCRKGCSGESAKGQGQGHATGRGFGAPRSCNWSRWGKTGNSRIRKSHAARADRNARKPPSP